MRSKYVESSRQNQVGNVLTWLFDEFIIEFVAYLWTSFVHCLSFLNLLRVTYLSWCRHAWAYACIYCTVKLLELVRCCRKKLSFPWSWVGFSKILYMCISVLSCLLRYGWSLSVLSDTKEHMPFNLWKEKGTQVVGKLCSLAFERLQNVEVVYFLSIR